MDCGIRGPGFGYRHQQIFMQQLLIPFLFLRSLPLEPLYCYPIQINPSKVYQFWRRKNALYSIIDLKNQTFKILPFLTVFFTSVMSLVPIYNQFLIFILYRSFWGKNFLKYWGNELCLLEVYSFVFWTIQIEYRLCNQHYRYWTFIAESFP